VLAVQQERVGGLRGMVLLEQGTPQEAAFMAGWQDQRRLKASRS
jgi:hypothetical protein